MKKLLLLFLVLNLCSVVEGQSQSQSPSQKRPKFSSHSNHAQFVKPPHFRFEEMESDSSEAFQQDERLRSSLPPHLRGIPDLPPHILAERRWLLQSEAENAGLGLNDPLDRLYPPHKRPSSHKLTPLQNATPHHCRCDRIG